jgi:hypothetical protein
MYRQIVVDGEGRGHNHFLPRFLQPVGTLSYWIPANAALSCLTMTKTEEE